VECERTEPRSLEAVGASEAVTPLGEREHASSMTPNDETVRRAPVYGAGAIPKSAAVERVSIDRRALRLAHGSPTWLERAYCEELAIARSSGSTVA
jgi:hypothetical protein